MAEQVGISDPDEVKKARAKYLAVKRAEWRLRQRLATIDYEYEEIRPGLAALEKRITVLGELPEFSIVESDGNGKD